jgi:hypothetical protein
VYDIWARHPGYVGLDVPIALIAEVVDHHLDQVSVLFGFRWISLHEFLHDFTFLIL